MSETKEQKLIRRLKEDLHIIESKGLNYQMVLLYNGSLESLKARIKSLETDK